MKDWANALAAFEAVADGWRELLARAPDDLTARYGLATALSSVASATASAVSPDASFLVFRETLGQCEAIARDHPDYRPARTALVGLRYAYTEALIAGERFQQSHEEARTGLDLADELLASDPNDVQIRRWRGLLFHNAGWALQSRAEAALEGGADADQAVEDLMAARDELQWSLEVFEGLRDEGKLLPFEQGHIPAILERIEAVDALLEAQ